MKLNCDQKYQGCQLLKISKTMHSAVVGRQQFFFSDFARSAHGMLPAHSKPIAEEILAGTELNIPWFYLGFNGTNSTTTVNTSLHLFD
jgi:hypothetical protein